MAHSVVTFYMAKIKDLTGHRFGRLLVIKMARKDGCIFWECLCDCGKITTASSGNLKAGKIVSCGCYRLERLRESICIDLSGKKFGRLTVIKKDGANKFGHTMYLCVCECGKICRKEGATLKSGGVSSCGCLQKELTINRSTTHGLTHTKIYRKYRDRKRRDLSITNDCEWTVEMEVELRKLFTSCVICDSKERLEVDHVHPLSGGHGLKPGNATILCHYHNQSKWKKELNELPENIRKPIIDSAEKFRIYWISYLEDRTRME